MMNIRTLRDGTFAREYLLGYLSHGLSTLATTVYERYRFEHGRFLIIAPDSVDVDQLTQFGPEIRGIGHSAAIVVFTKLVKKFVDNRQSTVLL